MRKFIFSMSLTGLIGFAFVMIGCAGHQQTTASEPAVQKPGVAQIEDANIETVQQQPKLSGCGAYSTVVVKAFKTPEQFKKDYPYAVNQCIFSMMSHLRNKNCFSKVVEFGGNTVGRTVTVEGEILDMRITSPAARFWAGAMAGSSYMNVYLKMSDGATGRVLDERVISCTANAIAAAWTGGANDKSLPMDMGKIIGEYIYTVLPAKR